MAFDALEEKLTQKYGGTEEVSPSGETPVSTQTPEPEVQDPLEAKLTAKYSQPQAPEPGNILSALASNRPLTEISPTEVGAPTPAGIPSQFPATQQFLEFAGSGLPSVAKAPSVLLSLIEKMRKPPVRPPWEAPSISEALDTARAGQVPPGTGQAPTSPWINPNLPLTEPRMTPGMTGNVAQAAEQSPEAMLRQIEANPQMRLFRNVSDALEKGDIDIRDLIPVLQRENMSIEDFSKLYQATVSTAGRQLQQLSRLRYVLAKEAAKNPALKVFQDAVEKDLPPLSPWDKIRNLWRTFDDKRRALMITQFATTARNIFSQTGRYSLEVLDQAIQKGLGAKDTNAMELTMSFFRQLTPKGRNQILDVLQNDPLTMAKLLNNPTGELSAGKVITRTLNTLNTMQESFFRRAAFDGTIRSRLASRGIDVAEAMANPQLIPEDIWKEATQRALEVTFAARPDFAFGKSVLKMYQEFPFLTTIQPYPRFWVNALKFQYDYSPLAFAKAAYKWKAGEPTQAELSKGLIGTAMLAGGMAIRYNDSTAGPRWYQIKTGVDAQGNAKVIDTRPFAPFSTYLFLADVIKHAVNAGQDSWQNGRNLLQALQDQGMSSDDIIQGFLSMNRLGGTGLVFADIIKEGSTDRKMDMLADFVGNYLSGFTVPIRILKDFVAGEQGGPAATIRENRAQDLLGKIVNPTLGNFPQTMLPESLQLPEATSSLRKGVLTTETPIQRQLTGVAARTINPVEQEVARLDVAGSRFMPRTGDLELDRLTKGKMGDLVEEYGPPIIRSVAYKTTNDAGRRLMLVQFLQSMRRMALKDSMEEFKKSNPETYKELRLKRLPEEIEGVMGR